MQHPPGGLNPGLRELISRRLARVPTQARQIERLLADLRGFVREHDPGRPPGPMPIKLIHDGGHLLEAVQAMARAAAQLDIVSMAPDKERFPWGEALEGGTIQISSIVQTDILALPGACESLRQMTAHGVRLRTLEHVPGWFAVIGRDVAGLPTTWEVPLPARHRAIALFRSPVIAGALRERFERLWAEAAELPPPHDDPRRAVLRLAATGMSDEAAARHLGVSVRTVRARFAEAMSALGARSRFQAGVAAARRGWIPRFVPADTHPAEPGGGEVDIEKLLR